MKGLIFQKILIRVLLFICVLSVFSVSVFAAGTSTSPAYPTSTYNYVTGISTAGTVQKSTATFFDAVTSSFVGIGSILGTIWNKLGTINTYVSSLPTIQQHTGNISTINTYVQSSNRILSDISKGVTSIQSSISGSSGGSSAWDASKVSTVTSNIKLIEDHTFDMALDSAANKVHISSLDSKVATEVTLKTLATESTVSSIKSILSGFNTYLDTISEKTSDLAEVLASEEDKQLHDNSKSNLDYVNGSFSSNISDTGKFDVAGDAGSSFSSLFASDYSADVASSLQQALDAGNGFWSSSIYQEINGNASAISSYSADGDSSLPYDPYESYKRMMARFGSVG